MKQLIGHRNFFSPVDADDTLPLVVDVATTFWKRFKGLMQSDRLPYTRGLLIPECTSVHTCFVRYALDVVYIDREGVVVRLVPNLRPWRISIGTCGAEHVLELAAGGIARLGIHIGDRLLERLDFRSRQE